MSHHLGTTTCPTFIELDLENPGPVASRGLTVLIRVPPVRVAQGGPRPARRPTATATARILANRATVGPRPRRRLRKRVRTAACVVIALATLASAACLLRSGIAPGSALEWEATEPVPTRLASASAPAVWLRIETAPGDSPSAPEPPVILPGYLLPDDGIEEPDHARR